MTGSVKKRLQFRGEHDIMKDMQKSVEARTSTKDKAKGNEDEKTKKMLTLAACGNDAADSHRLWADRGY